MFINKPFSLGVSVCPSLIMTFLYSNSTSPQVSSLYLQQLARGLAWRKCPGVEELISICFSLPRPTQVTCPSPKECLLLRSDLHLKFPKCQSKHVTTHTSCHLSDFSFGSWKTRILTRTYKTFKACAAWPLATPPGCFTPGTQPLPPCPHPQARFQPHWSLLDPPAGVSLDRRLFPALILKSFF